VLRRSHRSVLPFGALILSACQGPGDIHIDLRRDAGGPVPFEYDAPSAASCETSCLEESACDLPRCVDGVCVHTPMPDGLACTEDGASICVEGACVERRCGDGYREPGTTEHPVERCDLGEGSALCDALCEPSVGVLVEAEAARADVALGIDDRGHTLLVWVARDPGTGAAVRAQTFDARMRPSGEATELARDPSPHAALEPAVVGLREGWAIALSHPALGAVVAILAPSLAIPRWVPLDPALTTAASPALARLDTGFVFAATSLEGSIGDPLAGVVARLFDDDATPQGGPFVVPSDTHALESEVTLAAHHDDWLALWTSLDTLDGSSRVVARRFTGRAPLGPEVTLSTAGVYAWGASAAPLTDGSLAGAWIESSSTDRVATIVLRDGAFSPGPIVEGPPTAGLVLEVTAVPDGPGAPAVTFTRGSRLQVLAADMTALSVLVSDAPHARPQWASGSLGALGVWADSETSSIRGYLLPQHD
jgi:hypothetical protein